MLNALLSIYQKASFKINDEESNIYDALTIDVLDNTVEYIRNFPDVSPEGVLHYIDTQSDIHVPTRWDNCHPLALVFVVELIELAKTDDFFIEEGSLEQFMPTPWEQTAPESLSTVTQLAADHPVVTDLNLIYGNAHLLSDNVAEILHQIAHLVTHDAEALPNVIVTTQQEVASAAADGGFSKSEAEEILDNKVVDTEEPDLQENNEVDHNDETKADLEVSDPEPLPDQETIPLNGLIEEKPVSDAENAAPKTKKRKNA